MIDLSNFIAFPQLSIDNSTLSKSDIPFITNNHSMIFQTFNNNIDKSIAKIGIFNKSLWAIQQDFKHGNGLAFSIFGGQSVTAKDRQAILDFNTKLQNGVKPAKAWATTMSNCSIAAQTQARQCLKAKGSLTELANGLKTTTISAKAASVAFKALSIAGNIIAFAAIAKGIQSATTVIDNWIHRVEKANEAMNDSVSEYESAKSSLESVNSKLDEQNKKIEELLSKDKLTYVEKGQLEELQAVTQELLLQQDIEERRAANASKEAADDTVDAYKKQYGKYDNTEEALQKKFSYDSFILGNSNDVLSTIADYIRAKELLDKSQKEFDNAVRNNEDTTWLANELQHNIDLTNDYKKVLNNNISDLEEKRVALKNEYDKVIEKQRKGIEPLSTSETEIISTYESICDIMEMIYKYTDPNAWNQIQLDGIFKTEGIELTKDELIEMYNAGKLTEEVLQSYPNLFKAISEAEFFNPEQFTVTERQLQNIQNVLISLSKYGNVDLTIRPIVDESQIRGQFIWQGDEKNGRYVYVHYTPVLPSGDVMSDDTLSNYIAESLNGAQNILDADTERIVIKVDTDFDIPEADISNYLHTGETTEGIDKLIGSATVWDNHVQQTKESFQSKQNTFNGIINNANEILNQIAAEADGKAVSDSGNGADNNSPTPFNRSTGFTEEQSKAIDDFQAKIKTLKDTLSTLQAGGDPGFTDLVQDFPELQGQSENLEEAIKRLINDSLEELYDTLGEGLPYDVKNDLESMADAALNLAPSLDEAFSSAKKSYDALHDFEDAMSSDSLTDSILSSVGALSDSLNDMVAGFYAGIVSSDELYKALSEHYQNDLANYSNALIIKNQYNESFYTAMGMDSAETINTFKEHYGVDLENCKNYAMAKMRIEAQTLGKIKDGWQKYYNVQTNTFTKEYQALLGLNEQGDEGAGRKALEVAKEARAYQEAMKALEKEVKIDDIEATFEGITSSLNKTSNAADQLRDKQDKEKEAVIETIDWIERWNQAQKEAHDSLMELAEDETASYEERRDALRELIDTDKERAEAAEESAARYEKEWEKAKEGLKEEDIARIENGENDIIEYEMKEGGEYEEGYVDNLEKAMDLYDKMVAKEKEANDLKKEQKEHLREEIRLQGELIDAQQELLSLELERARAKLDMAETSGKAVTEAMYRSMISASDDMADSYRDEIDHLEDQLWDVDEGSEEYYRIKAQIGECERAIADCKREQAEWNEAIKRIPIDRISKYIATLQNIKQDLQNFLDQQSAMGLEPSPDQLQQMIDLSQEEITKLLDQQEKLRKLLSEYEYGSEKYEQVSQEIQGIDDQISSLIQSQMEYNETILRMPVDQLQKQADLLSNARSDLENKISEREAAGFGKTLEQYEALSSISKEQIESLIAQKEMLTALLDVYDKDSSKYKETQDEIQGIEDTISSLIQEQARWNQEILKIPVDQVSEYVDSLSNARNDLENGIAIQESGGVGKTLEQYQALHDMSMRQIAALNQQKSVLLSVMDVYGEGSDGYKEAESQLQGIENSISSLIQEQVGWNDEILRLPINKIQEYGNSLSNIRSDLENSISEQESRGISKTLEQYQALQALSTRQIESLSQRKEMLTALLGMEDKGSSKYAQIEGEIQEVENSISSLIQEQEKWNQEILRIPIDKIGSQVDALSNARKDLENSVSEGEAKGVGKSLEQYQALHDMSMEQLALLSRQKDMLTSLLSTYDEDSDIYRQTQDEIQGIEDNISSLIQEQSKWNQELLRIPIDKISSQYDSLSNARKDLENNLSEQEASGIGKTLEQYQALHSMSMEQIQILSRQKDMLTASLDMYDKDSDIYKQTQDEIQGIEDNISSLIQEQAKWNQEILRIPVGKLEGYGSLLSNARSDLENSIAEQEAKGVGKTLDQYKALQSVSMSQIENLSQQKEALTALLDVYDKDSSLYADTLSQIQGIEDQISSLAQEQEKWNQEILRMPVDQMVEYSDSLDSVKSDLQNFLDTQNVRGIDTTVDQYQQLNAITLTQLDVLKTRKDMLTQLLGQYDKDSDAYKTTSDEINEVDSAIQSLVREQYEWNKAILQLPIDNISKINEELNRYSSALGDALGDYDTALSAVNGVLDDQIDKINESREASEKAYEDKIKPIQDELDLLKKQNDERSVQLALEQAAYDLDRAKNQKTTQVRLIA